MKPRAPNGFTLIEVIVALVVFAFVMAGLAQAARFGMTAWSLEDRLAENAAQLERMDRVLRGLIEQASPPVATDDKPFAGEEHRLTMMTLLPDEPQTQPIRHAQVAIGVDDKHRLVLRWRPRPNAAPLGALPALQEIVLAEGVERIDLAYRAGSADGGKWGRPGRMGRCPRWCRYISCWLTGGTGGRIWLCQLCWTAMGVSRQGRPSFLKRRSRQVLSGCRGSFPLQAQDETGFALLLVLWSMALLSLLAAQVTGAGRAETKLANALRSGAQLQAAADAAVQETIWHMLDGSGDFWQPAAMTRVLNEPGGAVRVVVTDERGKLDINQSPVALLQALFATVGADRTTAQKAANAIAEWRSQQPAGADIDSATSASYRMDGRVWGPAGQEFQRLDELKLVLGISPALYQASLPFLTLALEQGPWTDYAGVVVQAAIARAKRDSGLAVDAADTRGPIVLRIEAQAAGPNGAAFTRRVLFRLDGTLSGPAWKYRVLGWEDGPPPQG